MELGLALEDEDLGKTRIRKTAPTLVSYNAKFCTHLWFEEEARNLDDNAPSETGAQVFKFNADLQYFRGNYSEAVDMFVKSLNVLPPSSQAMRLDIHQSLARCYLRLEQIEKALEMTRLLVDTAQNIDQKKQSFILKTEAALARGCLTEACDCLQFIITQHPHYAQLWLQLADVYQQLEHDDRYLVRLATCYLRAKLLMCSVTQTVSEVMRCRDKDLINTIDQQVKDLLLDEKAIAMATEFLGRDIKLEKCKDLGDLDNAPADSSSSLHTSAPAADFESRWFGWIKSCPLLRAAR